MMQRIWLVYDRADVRNARTDAVASDSVGLDEHAVRQVVSSASCVQPLVHPECCQAEPQARRLACIRWVIT